mmetsp:Transcript_6884/g.14199  ORF Transcript_6884/g.14199 Transcript_6884/m.14199 type:complete len:265 (+) Transcript_6884:147-941(+)
MPPSSLVAGLLVHHFKGSRQCSGVRKVYILQAIQDLGEVWSVRGFMGPTQNHQLAQVRRAVGRHGLEVRPRTLHREPAHGSRFLLLEGYLAAYDLEEDHPVGVNVHLLVVYSAGEDLWRHPVARPCGNRHLAPFRLRRLILHAGEAKVGYLHQGYVLARQDGLGQQQVQGLQVPVNDLWVELVEVVHRPSDVHAHFVLLHPLQLNVIAIVQEFEAASSCAEFRYYAKGPLQRCYAEEPHEVIVVDLGHDSNLPVKGPLLLDSHS